MENVKIKYLKDETGEVISPVTSADSVFINSVFASPESLNSFMNKRKIDYFSSERFDFRLEPGETKRITLSQYCMGLLMMRLYCGMFEQCVIYVLANSNGAGFCKAEVLHSSDWNGLNEPVVQIQKGNNASGDFTDNCFEFKNTGKYPKLGVVQSLGINPWYEGKEQFYP